MQTFAISDKGPRNFNQDYFCLETIANKTLAAVADGVGGNNGGEIASKTTIDLIMDGFLNSKSLEASAYEAHALLLKMGLESPTLMGMATTLTAVSITDQFLMGVHCGDSRAYILRGKGIKQLTQDQTEVAMLLEEGLLTKETVADYPRKNVLTSAIGYSDSPLVQSFSFDVQPGDRLLLLTDGIYTAISKREIYSLSAAFKDFAKCCDQILLKVNEAGTNDNYTLVGIEF
ncbi:PP2C family protein-serine/threonine phosphatase [Methylovorus sp. SPW-M1]